MYQARYPDRPWLTRESIVFLKSFLKPDMVGFEWGSGRSTPWFAKRCGLLVSIEDDAGWYATVREKVKDLSVDLVLTDAEDDGASYTGKILQYPDEHFDFIIVDGSYRDR